ncbi:MAG: hypothetical protein JNN11_01225 [Candidatus Doudnabacteria bacterium]|nr:hypothetical protein [Candidatus Doudnabacteria bacterium]
MNQFLHDALNVETPGKVFGLLGAAMFSLAFMVAVSMSDASFSQTYTQLSDPFSMENVVAAIDNGAVNYSKFVQATIVEPAEETYAVYASNISWLAEESGMAYALGFEDSALETPSYTGRVAGASIQSSQYKEEGGLMDSIYKLLIE